MLNELRLTASPVSDFLVKGHTFEVGGKVEESKTITDICLVVDN